MCLEDPGWVDRTPAPSGEQQEVFDAETSAVYQALRAFDQRQESGRQYTVFVYSTSAITRVRDDAMGPG